MRKATEQYLHAAEVTLRRVHANLGHPSNGLMLHLLRDAHAPPEMIAVARIFHRSFCRTGGALPVQVYLVARSLDTPLH